VKYFFENIDILLELKLVRGILCLGGRIDSAFEIEGRLGVYLLIVFCFENREVEFSFIRGLHLFFKKD
jgi:hypothetical protein